MSTPVSPTRTRACAGTPRGLFVAGTDTEIGKTRTAVSVIRALAGAGLRVAAMKPVAAGAERTAAGLRNGDALALAAAANVTADVALVNPYCLIAPVSPHIAAADAGICIEIAIILRAFHQLADHADCVVVEGAGGWLAPIGERESMADVALALGLPVLLVVGLRLGCLNHALLSAREIEASGLRLAGWIANHIDPAYERLPENVATLERLLDRPPVAFIPHEAPGAAPRAMLEPGVELSAEASRTLRELLSAA
ncbi:MAG: dethiobiotin synthase [Steroidobacteraceae bacterium]